MADESTQANQIIQILCDWNVDQRGDASEVLLKPGFSELRQQPQHYLQKKRRGRTLQTIALVDETYLKLPVKQRQLTNKNRPKISDKGTIIILKTISGFKTWRTKTGKK